MKIIVRKKKKDILEANFEVLRRKEKCQIEEAKTRMDYIVAAKLCSD
jgi:hypothetical protein